MIFTALVVVFSFMLLGCVIDPPPTLTADEQNYVSAKSGLETAGVVLVEANIDGVKQAVGIRTVGTEAQTITVKLYTNQSAFNTALGSNIATAKELLSSETFGEISMATNGLSVFFGSTALVDIVRAVLSGLSTTVSLIDAPTSAPKITIGINQFLQHPMLDAARIGFTERLDELMTEAGRTASYNYQNASANSATATVISNNFINNNVDIIFALTTPSAQSARNAAAESGTPIVYGAVTAPEAPTTGLTGHDHVAGVSDRIEMESVIELIKQLLGGSVNHITYIYTASEDNPRIQGEQLTTAANALGITVTMRSINNFADLPSVMVAISNSDAEAIYIGTDNLLASNMTQVANLNRNGPRLPIITGAATMVADGGVASLAVNYTNIGIQAAEIAFRILVGGETPGDIPPFYFEYDTLDIHVNTSVAADIGFTIPQALIDRATTVIQP